MNRAKVLIGERFSLTAAGLRPQTKTHYNVCLTDTLGKKFYNSKEFAINSSGWVFEKIIICDTFDPDRVALFRTKLLYMINFVISIIEPIIFPKRSLTSIRTRCYRAHCRRFRRAELCIYRERIRQLQNRILGFPKYNKTWGSSGKWYRWYDWEGRVARRYCRQSILSVRWKQV